MDLESCFGHAAGLTMANSCQLLCRDDITIALESQVGKQVLVNGASKMPCESLVNKSQS